jgi:hypothetical protein
MDTQASLRWLETMKRERNAKMQWEQKYLTAEELQRSQEEQDALGAIEAAKPPPGKRLTERDVMMQRLSKYAAGRPEEEPPPKMGYQLQRERIAREVANPYPNPNPNRYPNPNPNPNPGPNPNANPNPNPSQVAASRPRNHRITRDLTTPALLADMGPGLWISVNPGYVHANKAFFTSSQHKVHEYDPKKGWADPVDKTFHLKQDDFMAFADKCLELNEKPFVGGGMKLAPAAT